MTSLFIRQPFSLRYALSKPGEDPYFAGAVLMSRWDDQLDRLSITRYWLRLPCESEVWMITSRVLGGAII
jgi:hypothetical protein